MATLIALIQETQYGEENIYYTIARAKHFEQMASEFGATVKGLYWTMGSCDGVLILDVRDAKSGAALIYRLTSGGAVKAEVMTAFDAEEMATILAQSQKLS